jgi:hypothetical protein
VVKKVSLFIFANLVFVTGVVAIYAVGYEYDRAHKLYPEFERMSYDLSMEVYGRRWDRTAKALLIVGVLADAVILVNWYRKQQGKRTTFLYLDSNV